MTWFLNFTRKNTSWACLEGLGLKLIFHWCVQLLIFHNSLFKTLINEVISQTIEKREVPFGKSLGFDDNPVEKSFLQIKNKKDPIIESWRTPGFTAAHLETYPFKTTLCYRFARMSSMILSRFPDIPFSFSLNSAHWSKTLSKAFDILRKRSLTSQPSLNDLQISLPGWSKSLLV